MTTRTTTGSRRIWIGWAAAVGTLPYLVLKLIWLGGGSVGMVSPSAVEGATMVAGNAITVIADVLLVVVVVALTRPWGRRLPAWMLLLTGWAGTGLLVPIALTILPTVVITAVVGGSIGDGSMADWVGPLVYGSFAWQGGMLAIAFFLVEATEENGCLQVQPRVHQQRMVYWTYSKDLPQTEKIFLPMQKGDVLIMHKLTPHGSGPNNTDAVRWSMDLRYQQTGEPSPRPEWPNLIARSRRDPNSETVYEDWRDQWAAALEETPAQLSYPRPNEPLPFKGEMFLA